jgi:hypothetical protein
MARRHHTPVVIPAKGPVIDSHLAAWMRELCSLWARTEGLPPANGQPQLAGLNLILGAQLAVWVSSSLVLGLKWGPAPAG